MRHLQISDPRGKLISHLVIEAEETKNANAIYWPIPAESAVVIDTFIKRHRKHLGDAESSFLFPGQMSGARTKGTIRRHIGIAAQRYLGVQINPHLLRSYAAWSHLKEHPGDYETVRRVLGHKDIRTTIAYYTGLENEFAAMKFDATILKARRDTRAAAQVAFKALRFTPPGVKPPGAKTHKGANPISPKPSKDRR